MRLIVHPAAKLEGEVNVPGDKSISHRALMCGAIARGTTTVHNFLPSDDCNHTLKVLKQLGVPISVSPSQITLEGQGLWGLQRPLEALYFGNAGTSIRLMAGLLAGQSFDSVLFGDPHLNKRPMNRVILPLSKMGAKLSGESRNEEQYPPLQITGGQSLKGISYDMPIASAQIKSCLLFAGLYAKGVTEIISPSASRDHTERLMKYMGASLDRDGQRVRIAPGELKSKRIEIPNDISSAAFFLVGAAMKPGSDILLKNVGLNPTRCGVLKILDRMGADITILNQKNSFEPVADLRVRGQQLKGTTVPMEWIGEAIDEFPILFIAASAASGTSIFRGLQELTVKESNRLEAMATGLAKCGVALSLETDGLVIEGGQKFKGGQIQSFADHRIAMSFAMASLLAEDIIEIDQSEYISTSFPNFADIANSLGLKIVEKEN